MEYSSIRDITEDQELGLRDVEPTADAVRDAIDDKLRLLQSETVTETPEIYRRLISAREAIDKLDVANEKRQGTELIPMPTVMLERLLDAIQKPSQVTEQKGPTVTERMQASRSVAITKASQDFRNRRKLPLAGLGAVSAILWGTRQAFGANLSNVGTIVWSAAAGVILLMSIFFLAIVSRIQNSDEDTLRQLYDPDTQAIALEGISSLVRTGVIRERFTRNIFRKALWYIANNRTDARVRFRTEDIDFREAENFRETIMSFPGPRERKGLRFLSTTDFVGALDDSSELAIARFIEMGVLRSKQERGREMFEFILSEGS